MHIIDKIFQLLNDDNIIPQFIRVLQKKTTEKAVNINCNKLFRYSQRIKLNTSRYLKTSRRFRH